jgi:Ni2+-binding GTPase involved in maturation of urease and hydrogenase
LNQIEWRSDYYPNWLDSVKTIFAKELPPMLLALISPPGAGKTELVRSSIIPQAREQQYLVEYVDGSSDELVQVVITAILEQRFPQVSEKANTCAAYRQYVNMGAE